MKDFFKKKENYKSCSTTNWNKLSTKMTKTEIKISHLSYKNEKSTTKLLNPPKIKN